MKQWNGLHRNSIGPIKRSDKQKKRINLTTENQNQIQCYVPTNN